MASRNRNSLRGLRRVAADKPKRLDAMLLLPAFGLLFCGVAGLIVNGMLTYSFLADPAGSELYIKNQLPNFRKARLRRGRPTRGSRAARRRTCREVARAMRWVLPALCRGERALVFLGGLSIALGWNLPARAGRVRRGGAERSAPVLRARRDRRVVGTADAQLGRGPRTLPEVVESANMTDCPRTRDAPCPAPAGRPTRNRFPPLYAMTHGGIETVAADEITRDLGGEVKKTSRGLVVFRVEDLTDAVLDLRTTEDVFLLAWGSGLAHLHGRRPRDDPQLDRPQARLAAPVQAPPQAPPEDQGPADVPRRLPDAGRARVSPGRCTRCLRRGAGRGRFRTAGSTATRTPGSKSG